MSLGFSIGSILLFIIQPVLKFQDRISLTLWWSVGAGIIWATSFVLFISSIDKVGLSKSNQWKNLQGPIAAILGLIILGESAKINPFFALLAASAIFLSAVFFTISSDNRKGVDIKGVYFALLAAAGFGSVAVIQKHVTAHTGIYLQQVIWSLSIATSLFLYIFLNGKINEILKSSKREFVLGLLAGILYLGASAFQLFSYLYLPVSISFTIVQMNSLWTIIIGILIFREINFKKYHKNVSLGLIFTIIGILFLVFTRK